MTGDPNYPPSGVDSQTSEPAAQQRTTCGVCKGEKELRGWLRGAMLNHAIIRCDECRGTGTVPAGDLAQWQEKAEQIVGELASILMDADAPLHVVGLFEVLRAHLAAMPQPDVASQQRAYYVVFDGPPNNESGRFIEVETVDGEGAGPEQTGAQWREHPTAGKTYWHLGPFYSKAMPAQPDVNEALGRAISERDVWKKSYQEQITILESLDPRMDGTEDLLKALRETAEGLDSTANLLWQYVLGSDIDWIRRLHGSVRMLEEAARAAIAQAEKGAAG